MTLFEQAAPGAVGPGLASAALFAAAALVGRRTGRSWLRDVLSALAVAGGFAVGFAVVLEWPALPLGPGTDAFYWVAWFAAAGWLAGLFETCRGVPGPVRLLVRLALSLGAAWLLLEPLVPHALPAAQAWLRAGVGAVGMTVLWSVAAREGGADEHPGRVALPFGIAAGTTAAILAFLAGSLSMGQVTGGLSAAVMAAFALGWLLRAPATSRATAPVLALVFGGLLLGAFAYLNYGDSVYFPHLSSLLLALGAVVGVYAPRALGPNPSFWASSLLGAIPPVLLSALAAWIAHASAPPPNPYGG